jgi:hypothetical protein
LVDALYVSGEFFSTLGVPALHGRVIRWMMFRAGATPVAVVSYRLWQRKRGSNVIGTDRRRGRPVTIVGVTPRVRG